MALFQNGQGDGHVIGSFIVLPVLIKQILVIDVAKKLSVESSKMSGHKWILPETVVLYYILRQFSGVTG
jgi:hypothetical protein